jgi:hypothetical protein
MKGWPLSRKIRVSILKDGFVSKAVQHFLQLARRKMPEGRFHRPSGGSGEAEPGVRNR